MFRGTPRRSIFDASPGEAGSPSRKSSLFVHAAKSLSLGGGSQEQSAPGARPVELRFRRVVASAPENVWVRSPMRARGRATTHGKLLAAYLRSWHCRFVLSRAAVFCHSQDMARQALARPPQRKSLQTPRTRGNSSVNPNLAAVQSYLFEESSRDWRIRRAWDGGAGHVRGDRF